MKWMLGLCILLAGCTGTEENTPVKPEPAAETGDYESYAAAINDRIKADAWTAAVSSRYTFSYEDESSAIYEMDGTLDAQDADGNVSGRLKEHINGNGMASSMDGYYYDGRLYNTYNGIVSYYEDMPFADLKKTLLVPLEPYAVPEDSLEGLYVSEEEGQTVYTAVLNESSRKDLFLSRYDFYGMDQLSDLHVLSGRIIDSFDAEGRLIREEADFETEASYSGHRINVAYHSSLSYLGFDSVTVAVSDEQKKEQSSYPAFADIDTGSIETADVPDDSAEATAAATLRKRLVNRLGYEQKSEDVYELIYNDHEAYAFDFANGTFTYSNYTINYVYNWKGDVATMGKCTFMFETENASSDCADTTIEMMNHVRDFLRMELYYCGLSYDEFIKEENA